MLVARDNTIRQQEMQLRHLYQTLQGMQACMTGVLGGAAIPGSAVPASVEPAVTPTPSPTANL